VEILVIAILVLPTLCALALLTAYFDHEHRLSSQYIWAIGVGTCLISLALAWALPFNTNIELLIGEWSPISVTHIPLTISVTYEGAILFITLLTVLTYRALINSNPIDIFDTIYTASLCAAALSNTFLTLIVMIGIADLVLILSQLRQISTQTTGATLQKFSPAIINCISLAIIFIAIIGYVVSANSLYFPLAEIDDRTCNIILFAALLRFLPLPFNVSSHTVQYSSFGGFIILMHLTKLITFNLNTQLVALFIGLACVLLLMSGLYTQRNQSFASMKIGALSLFAITLIYKQPLIVAFSGSAWLLSTELLASRITAANSLARRKLRLGLLIARAVGGLCLIGFPFTIGFISFAGLPNALMSRPYSYWLIGFCFFAQSLLVFNILRLMSFRSFRQSHNSEIANPHSIALQRVSISLALTIMVLPILIWGISPSMSASMNVFTIIAQQELIGWSLWILSIGVGIVFWMIEIKLRQTFSAQNISWGNLVFRNQFANFVGLNWLGELCTGALAILGRPFRYFYDLFESDGSLIWAIIIVLLVILVAQRPSP
jgi:hypothetical protein